MMERVYGEKWHMEKEGGFKEHKRTSGWFWRKNGDRSEITNKSRKESERKGRV